MNCKHGHAMTEENTYVRSDGKKQCRECNRIRRRIAKKTWKSYKERCGQLKWKSNSHMAAFTRLPVIHLTQMESIWISSQSLSFQ